MPRLYLTKAQRSHLVQKYSISAATMSEIVHFRRPTCQKHAEIASYAVNELGARLIDD